MGSIAQIIEELEFGRSTIFKAIAGLSYLELTQTPIYNGWTIKHVLAHLAGWDEYALKTIPLIVANKADELPPLDVDAYNQQSLAARQNKSLAEILEEFELSHRRLLKLISELDHEEIDKRHQRHGRIITIRSYVINILMEHDREHALEIESWRKALAETIDPDSIRANLRRCRDEFTRLLDEVNEEEALAQGVVGDWSINEMVGHVADWEQLMLQAARHILDETQPAVEVPPHYDTETHNAVLAAARADKSWPENHRYLRLTQQAVDELVSQLTPEDWAKRGPYPWLNDQGNLAELITHIAGHYLDHTPDLERWDEQKRG